MPIKILLADKSITIQKVVEMLFSGKEYEVACVSDGETGLAEASRVLPDVVLADVDLPRIDGYSFSERLKKTPRLAQTPVILMMSRDDVFDQAKAQRASIVDHIAKPFESQELISKVKKAAGGGARVPAEPARPAAAKPVTPPAPSPAPSIPAGRAKPKQAAPTDIFDIIQEAPTGTDIKRTTAGAEDEGVYEVEPVVEVEERPSHEEEKALPVGRKAVQEMREGLGLTGERQSGPGTPASRGASRAAEPRAPKMPAIELEAREYVPPPPEPEDEMPAEGLEARIRVIAEEAVSRIAREHFKNMPAPRLPQVSEEAAKAAVEESVSRIVRETAREVIEKVAWEVVPDLAALLIREEIERLKAEP